MHIFIYTYIHTYIYTHTNRTMLKNSRGRDRQEAPVSTMAVQWDE
jgi:hypothetical protein